jgi:hypothetical protein
MYILSTGKIREIEREGCEYADKVICVSGRLCDEVCRIFRKTNYHKIVIIIHQ